MNCTKWAESVESVGYILDIKYKVVKMQVKELCSYFFFLSRIAPGGLVPPSALSKWLSFFVGQNTWKDQLTQFVPPAPLTPKAFLFLKLIWEGEREKHQFVVPLIYTFSGWFLYVPRLGVKPKTLAYRGDTLTTWAPARAPRHSWLSKDHSSLTWLITPAPEYRHHLTEMKCKNGFI